MYIEYYDPPPGLHMTNMHSNHTEARSQDKYTLAYQEL